MGNVSIFFRSNEIRQNELRQMGWHHDVHQLHTVQVVFQVVSCPRSTVRALNHTKVWSCLDFRSRENWPIAFAVRYPIPILVLKLRFDNSSNFSLGYFKVDWFLFFNICAAHSFMGRKSSTLCYGKISRACCCLHKLISVAHFIHKAVCLRHL